MDAVKDTAVKCLASVSKLFIIAYFVFAIICFNKNEVGTIQSAVYYSHTCTRLKGVEKVLFVVWMCNFLHSFLSFNFVFIQFNIEPVHSNVILNTAQYSVI